ncbi:MAG: Lrp/AsnC family transcriptional regulator [Synergistaceae bacterium]|nr:Lrp/AsnC family transcriptional regulator [Synergistaceae bacterium]
MAERKNNPDDTDWKILAELQRDARSSYKDIGEAVGMTRPAARERILRMEESGVIGGYSADIDTEALGRALHVMVSFKFNSDQRYERKPNDVLVPFLRASAEVIRFWEIYGELDFLIEAAFSSKERMQEFLDDLRSYGFVRSHLIASSVKCAVRPETDNR